METSQKLPSSSRIAPLRIGVIVATTMLLCVSAGTAYGSIEGNQATESNDSATIDATTMISGAVTKDGTPFTQADVTLVAWPNQEELTMLGDGERVNTEIVGRASTDSVGRFAISLDPSTIGSAYTGADGEVDIELVVADSDNELVWYFTAVRATPELARKGNAWGNPRVDQKSLAGWWAEGLGPAHVIVDLGKTPSVVERGNEPSTWVDDNNESLSIPEAKAAAQAAIQPRRVELNEDAMLEEEEEELGAYWCATSTYYTGISEAFVNSIGTVQGKPYVAQTTSSSHTLGIAYKSGSSASWTQNGTKTVTTGASADNHLTYSGRVYNRVKYRKWVPCGFVFGKELRRVHVITSLNDYVVSIARPAWNYCSSTIYRSGSNSKVQGSNATFSSGVSLGVISVSSNASFTSNTKIRWQFSSTGAKLCGSNSNGWVSAPQARARVP